MKKHSLILFATLLITFVFQPLVANAGHFDDVEHDSRFASISYLVELGYIDGYDDGTFRPDALVNRAELVKILVEADGGYVDCFDDVMDGWYEEYVCYAVSKGWVSGYNDGKFYPERNVTRAGFAKIFSKARGYEPSADDLNFYDDVGEGDWFRPYLNALRRRGILCKYSGSIEPDGYVTRGNFSKMLYKSLLVGERPIVEEVMFNFGGVGYSLYGFTDGRLYYYFDKELFENDAYRDTFIYTVASLQRCVYDDLATTLGVDELTNDYKFFFLYDEDKDYAYTFKNEFVYFKDQQVGMEDIEEASAGYAEDFVRMAQWALEE